MKIICCIRGIYYTFRYPSRKISGHNFSYKGGDPFSDNFTCITCGEISKGNTAISKENKK